jgi:hypothetical protein
LREESLLKTIEKALESRCAEGVISKIEVLELPLALKNFKRVSMKEILIEIYLLFYPLC